MIKSTEQVIAAEEQINIGNKIMDNQRRFEQLIRAHHPCVLIITYEEDYALEIITKTAKRLTRQLWIWSVIDGLRDGMRLEEGLPISDTEHPAAALYFLLQRENNSIAVMRDLARHLNDARTLRLLRETISKFRRAGGTLILLDNEDSFPQSIHSVATQFELSYPDEAELEEIVISALREYNKENPIKIDITRKELPIIIRNLKGLSRTQAYQVIIDAVAEDHRFHMGDINTILSRKRQMIQKGGLLEYVESPTNLDEIGGLKRLKHWLKQREEIFSENAADFGLEAPKGVLMLGVQGAGKSLCAKAIATAWHRPLLRLDVGALYDRYIGESERRLRDALRQAEMMSPIIFWIDEIEKAFASAASRSTDGGLSQRMFGTLLTWMQEHKSAVFIVATANDIEALPPELLRKGRFDEIFFVDLPSFDTRKEIFKIHLRKRQRNPDNFDIDALSAASDGYSGAEIEQAIVAALHNAFAENKELDTSLIINALEQSPPLSVTMAERVQALREWAKGRCVPADE